MSRYLLRLGLLVPMLAGCIRVETKVDVSSRGSGVVFDAPIPEIPSTLQSYSLATARIEAPVSDLLGAACPDEASYMRHSAAAVVNNTKVVLAGAKSRCRRDDSTGEVDIYPDFDQLATELPGEPKDAKTRLSRGREILERDLVIPRGDTSFVVEGARALKHLRVERNKQTASKMADEPVLLYVIARRQVGEYRVDGPGARAVAMIGLDGKSRGFTRGWKTATRSTELKPVHDKATLQAEIERQLLAVGAGSLAHVQSIELVYYDANGTVLQPVFRFVAEFSAEHGHIGKTDHVVGYVPFARTAEPPPEIADGYLQTLQTATSQDASIPDRPNGEKAAAPTEIKVASYIVRDDRAGWQRDAEGFSRALIASNKTFKILSSHLPAFPEQFTTRTSPDFVDSVHLALLEAHGTTWLFSTRGTSFDPVYVGGDLFPKDGYGSSPAGLKHWILHSCEVLPGPVETPHWHEPWWRVFNGLQTVVGYRTSMFITDGAGAAFGRRIGQGEPIVSAWFSAVATLNVYGLGPWAKFRCNGGRPMGRPSAVTACGASRAALGDDHVVLAKDCLDAWWIEDAIVY